MGRGKKGGKKPSKNEDEPNKEAASTNGNGVESPPITDQCPVCNTPATQRCSGCKKVFYCGREHQREHWSSHKRACKESIIVESFSTELGRFLAAGRDIASGELILEEEPLLTCPPPGTPPLCLACYKELEADDHIDCPKCGWPLCSKQCAADPRDHALECALTIANRPEKMHITQFGLPHPCYQSIGAFRCLALEKYAPRKWEVLTQLESHSESRAGSERDRQERFGVAQFARRVLPGLVDTHSEDDILRMCGILQVNGHELPLRDPSLVTVYGKASLLAHSCRANCCKSFSSTGAVRLSAARPIKAGEPITICYTDSLWSIPARRSHLYETKLFWCKCERCEDPSECGTDFSALRCEKCGEAGVRPMFNGHVETDWVCRHCNATMPAKDALDLEERVGAEVENLDKGDVKACQRFLERWGGETVLSQGSETELSPDHHYLTDVRLALAQLYGAGGPSALLSLMEEELNHKIELCRRLLKLAKQLVPAEHRLRGLVAFECHAALAEKARRIGADGDADSARNTLEESKKCLEDAIEFLRYEPLELPEGQIALQAKRNMQTLACLLQPTNAVFQWPPQINYVPATFS